MQPSDERKLVEAEIAGRWSTTNDHDVDLRNCLVAPRKERCKNTFLLVNKGQDFNVWVVLEEHPGNKEGYVLIYHEKNRSFGLASHYKGELSLDWFCDTFLTAFKGM